jgi:hypothetical protein
MLSSQSITQSSETRMLLHFCSGITAVNTGMKGDVHVPLIPGHKSPKSLVSDCGTEGPQQHCNAALTTST